MEEDGQAVVGKAMPEARRRDSHRTCSPAVTFSAVTWCSYWM
jgi:hypothetical protein